MLTRQLVSMVSRRRVERYAFINASDNGTMRIPVEEKLPEY